MNLGKTNVIYSAEEKIPLFRKPFLSRIPIVLNGERITKRLFAQKIHSEWFGTGMLEIISHNGGGYFGSSKYHRRKHSCIIRVLYKNMVTLLDSFSQNRARLTIVEFE